jgi:hypothetical protein
MVAEHGADAFSPLSQLCLESLRNAIVYAMDASTKEKKKKSTHFYHARDNAVAALGKIIKF